MNKCPICNTQMEVDMGTINGEKSNEYIECPKGHYVYNENYGFVDITVGEKTFSYSYQDGYVQKMGVIEDIEKEIEKLKEDKELKLSDIGETIDSYYTKNKNRFDNLKEKENNNDS